MRPELHIKLDCPHCRQGRGLGLNIFSFHDRRQIEEGALSCANCQRWFPIIGGIPDLVPDGLREPERDKSFLEKWRTYIPDIADSGKPVNLSTESLSRSEDDSRILDDGNHWGDFMQRFWDVGDRSIFDIRCKGSHPRFFVAGVLERDERDVERRWGLFPDHVGDKLFSNLKDHAGKWGIDAGCGGGQFGLEAARQGVLMVGFDPGMKNVQLALAHARDQSVSIDYVRADPRHPPFKMRAFSLVMAKDSLHHVPHLERVFGRMVETLVPGGEFVCFEHIGRAPIKRAILERLGPPLIRKIRRRYPGVEVPAELLRDSANEDVSMAEVQRVVRAYFDPIVDFGELWLYHELEGLVHFAYGKRQWFTKLVGTATYVFEKLVTPFQPAEHWAFRGRMK